MSLDLSAEGTDTCPRIPWFDDFVILQFYTYTETKRLPETPLHNKRGLACLTECENFHT